MASDSISSGLKVADLASFIAAPSARILSDFGADVIKAVPSPHFAFLFADQTKEKGTRPELRPSERSS